MVLHCQMYGSQNFDQSEDFLSKSTRTTENGFDCRIESNHVSELDSTRKCIAITSFVEYFSMLPVNYHAAVRFAFFVICDYVMIFVFLRQSFYHFALATDQ